MTVITTGAAAAALAPTLTFGNAITAIATGSLATAAGGTIAVGAGVAGAVAGSVASQGVGIATGIQDKFSFKQVGLAAISAGISGGLGAAFPGGGPLGAAARGAASSALTQGVGVATGLQNKFDFVGVAAAGVGAAASSAFGDQFGQGISDKFGGKVLGGIASSIASGTAGGIANAATRSALNGSNFGDNFKAAIPDIIGSAIGNAVAGEASKTASSYSDRIKARLEGTQTPLSELEGTVQVAGPSLRAKFINGPSFSYEELLSIAGYTDQEIFSFQVENYKGALAQEYIDRVAGEPSAAWWETGNLGFGLGVGARFSRDTAVGIGALADFVFRDTLGSVAFHIREGANALTGSRQNRFRQSYLDFGRTKNSIVNGVSSFATPYLQGGVHFGNIITTAKFSIALSNSRTASNAQTTAFDRGFTNPDWQIGANVLTAGLAFSKAGSLRTLGALDNTIGLTNSLQQQRALSSLVSTARKELVEDTRLLSTNLRPAERAAIQNKPYLARVFFGTALERRVELLRADIVRQNPNSPLATLEYRGAGNSPFDYLGSGNTRFEITTKNPRTLATHQARPDVDFVVTYDPLPSGFGSNSFSRFSGE